VGPAAFGRVESDGTVYVRTSVGERAVGQVPDVPAADALGLITRRFEALELEVSLLERRIATGALSPDDAVASITKVRAAVADARAVGDLDGLQARLEALFPVIANQRIARKAERARQHEQTRAAKESYVWRLSGLLPATIARRVNRFVRCLRVEGATATHRATDDALWHRFPARAPPIRGVVSPVCPTE
jgi:hypothetical protein